MTEHRLKSTEANFLAIASGQRRVDPRLADRSYEAGDKVTFVRYDPAAKTEGADVSVKLTHVARFAPELFTNATIGERLGRYLVLGLTRPKDPVIVPENGAVALKTWPEYFATIENGRRVDLRSEKFWSPSEERALKHGSTVLFQEYDPSTKAYSGKTAIRQVRRVTPWAPREHYEAEQIDKHGVAVLGWKGLEPEAPKQSLEEKVA